MDTLRPDQAFLSPASAHAPQIGLQHPGRRKTSLPALFLHRKLSHTPSGDGAPPLATPHHHANGGVGHALKRIKKVVFASISHVHNESEPCPVPTILPPESPSPVRPTATGTNSAPAPAAVPQFQAAPKADRADQALLRSSPGRERERHYTDRSVDSRSSMDFYLDSDDEDTNSRTSTLLGQSKSGHTTRKGGGCDNLVVIISALYCKLLVVIGLAFPLSEVISSNIPPFYYEVSEVFYIYLYSCSILFLLYVYIFLLKDATVTDTGSTSKLSRLSSASISRIGESRIGKLLRMDSRTSASGDPETASQVSKTSQHKPYMVLVASYGSFYLRMGAVLFGIGSMIYSGLEMGQYFEVPDSAECSNVLRAVTPGLRLTFIFIQMYFVFLNASMSINKHKLLARFGLMHMVGTNLCVWLNVVIQETKHELVHLLSMFEPGGNHSGGGHHDRHRRDVVLNGTVDHSLPGLAASELHDIEKEFTTDLQEFHDSHSEDSLLQQCARSDIMGNLVDSASPFLFPCTIEYSLICAATLYVMWKNLNKLNTVYVMRDVSISLSGEKSKKHQYSVDCARASKGLFLGILVLVASIISLILFFVLINKQGFKPTAILSASMTELVLYIVTILAIVIGMMQIQGLRYRSESSIELDNILLVVAQTGVYLYASFNIIGSHFSNDLVSLGTSVMAITQVTMQTMFILDASCRQAYRSSQLRDKPGREVVTFLLICNLALWSIHVFETSRSDAHPHQLHFFGFWAWTIISHVSMPLAIFYRFHSTVCLCEIWKRAYKYKPESV